MKASLSHQMHQLDALRVRDRLQPGHDTMDSVVQVLGELFIQVHQLQEAITVRPGEIILKTGDASIVLKQDGTIHIKGKDITIDGSGKLTIKATGDLVMKGSRITQN